MTSGSVGPTLPRTSLTPWNLYGVLEYWGIVADSPFEARHHVIGHPNAELASDGDCPRCHGRVLAASVDRTDVARAITGHSRPT